MILSAVITALIYDYFILPFGGIEPPDLSPEQYPMSYSADILLFSDFSLTILRSERAVLCLCHIRLALILFFTEPVSVIPYTVLAKKPSKHPAHGPHFCSHCPQALSSASR